MDIPNPGSSVSCVGLNNRHWVLVCNDAMIGRNSLTVYLSDDEGETWKWRRPLERLETEGSASYPTVVQAADDAIHCTYSYKNPAEFQGSTIKHVRFNEAWVRASVQAARDRQRARYNGRFTCNAHLDSKTVRHHCALDDGAQSLLENAINRLGFSARAYDKVLRVARTLADLDAEDHIAQHHVSEAIQYRTLDRAIL